MKKEIKNMGKITFGKYYNQNNLVITNLNKSPIREHKKTIKINTMQVIELINNEYIYGLLKPRKDYQIFECKPIYLLSKYRYDVFVKYYYVKSYIENNNIDLARKIYLDHIKAFNNFNEPDGMKKTPEDFVEYFEKLINSLKHDGFSKTIIPISKTGIPIDGAHRLAIALYFEYKVPFVVFDLLDGKYNRNFFIKRGMQKQYIEIVDDVFSAFMKEVD